MQQSSVAANVWISPEKKSGSQMSTSTAMSSSTAAVPRTVSPLASSTSLRDLRMSELLERMQGAGIAQAEIDRCFDTASPKGAAISLLEARREAQAADPAMELHQLALEAEILLGPGAHDELRAAKAEVSQAPVALQAAGGSPLADRLSQLSVRAFSSACAPPCMWRPADLSMRCRHANSGTWTL
jgi:hypothetical protein